MTTTLERQLPTAGPRYRILCEDLDRYLPSEIGAVFTYYVFDLHLDAPLFPAERIVFAGTRAECLAWVGRALTRVPFEQRHPADQKLVHEYLRSILPPDDAETARRDALADIARGD